MKKLSVLLFALIIGYSYANSQTIYDGELFSNRELSGTARYVGMGGALGALGADISTMSTNPAGIGLYRSNDVAMTLGYTNNEVKSNFMGEKNSFKVDRIGLKNMGIVFSTPMYGSSLKYLNFGFNYHRSNDFYRSIGMSGTFNTSADGGVISIANAMAVQANNSLLNGNDVANASGEGGNIYANPRYGWMSLLGFNSYLINPGLVDGEKRYFPHPMTSPNALFHSDERGGINQYDFNISMNLSDRVFLGLTIGAYDLNYRTLTYYDEAFMFENNPKYKEMALLETSSEIDGSGYDFKLGVIVRPIENSPFRIGFAVHTPTFYNLTHYTNVRFSSDIYQRDAENQSLNLLQTDIDTYNELSGDNISDFKLRTPWKFNFSLGHNVGDFLALGAEYEYQDYSSMKFKYDGGGSMGVNTDMLKGVHTLKLGLEYRIVPEFAFRAGYNMQSGIFKEDAYKEISNNSVLTDVQYVNKSNVKNTFTFGVGYAGKVFYSDLAFVFDSYKSDFRPFDDPELNFTKLTSNKSQVLLTLGMRL